MSARVIPISGRPHLPSQLRSYDGDSVGHWEGETLVVDITNFNGRGWIATNAASGRIRGVPRAMRCTPSRGSRGQTPTPSATRYH